MGECSDSLSAGRPWKKWIDTVKECLRKRDFEGRQGKGMVHDRSE